MKLGGKGHLELTARSDKDGQKVDWQGMLEQLALEDMPPGLLSETIKLSGSAGLQANEAWRLDKVAMASPGFTFEMSGSGRQRTGQIDMTLALPRLGLLQEDVGGAASAKGKVVLTPTGGDLQFSVDLTDLSRGGISSKKLALVLDTTLDGQAVRGRLKADGDLANQPLKLDGQFQRNADGGVLVPAPAGRLGQCLGRRRQSRRDAQGRDRTGPSQDGAARGSRAFARHRTGRRARPRDRDRAR